MTPKTTDNLVIFIPLGLVSTKGERTKELTTENLILLTFVICIMPRLVLPGDEGGDDPKDDRQPCYLYRSCIDKGERS
jgi:hypothetical protein